VPDPRRGAAVLPTLVAAALLVACGAAPQPGAQGPGSAGQAPGAAGGRLPNVLLITVDTLRPDHLGCYGYNRKTSPNIDLLARRGVVFRQAISAAGRTVQSFPSILTGVYPMVHGLRYEGQRLEVLGDRLTLTRVLKVRGYDTFAVTQGLNVGLHRDFDLYDPDVYLDAAGRKVYLPAHNDREASRKGTQWLRGRRGAPAPFFLWMRYNAPHWPYEAPEPYRERFDAAYHGLHTFNEEAGPGVERGDLIFGAVRLPSREIEHAVAHYDGEVAYADEAIGELLKTLVELGDFDRTLVIVTSDHGESLGEHDYFFEHGAYLYDPTVRVPLILTAPGRLRPGRMVESQARTIDIFPTIVDLLGLPAPEGLQGISLLPWASGQALGPGPVAYAESGRNFYKENPRQYVDGVAGKWRMLRTERSKLIMIPKDPEPIWEFYDLRADPGERVNLAADRPAGLKEMKKDLLDLIAQDPARDDREEPPLPPELREELRSLGYVGGRPPR